MARMRGCEVDEARRTALNAVTCDGLRNVSMPMRCFCSCDKAVALTMICRGGGGIEYKKLSYGAVSSSSTTHGMKMEGEV